MLSERTKRILTVALADRRAAAEVVAILEAVASVQSLATAVAEDLPTLTAKLDADTGVTDTDYHGITDDNPVP